MKTWEIIADRLSAAGWSLGWVSAIDSQGRTIWIVDAHREDGRALRCARRREAQRVGRTRTSGVNRDVLSCHLFCRHAETSSAPLNSYSAKTPHRIGLIRRVTRLTTL
jgi:hypothetical protein